MISRLEAFGAKLEQWFVSKLVERRVRKALEPFIAATVETLVGQTAEGIPTAAPATIVALVLGAQQETLYTASGALLESSETEDGLDAPDALHAPSNDLSEAYSAKPEEIPAEPSAVAEPSAEEKRAALAVALRSRPEPRQDFAELLLASRGRGWE